MGSLVWELKLRPRTRTQIVTTVNLLIDNLALIQSGSMWGNIKNDHV